VFGSGTNYWIAPQNSTNSLIGGTYNWITQQQFYVPVSGFYRFDFPGAGDNELEFYIDGAVNTTNPTRPTITGGQQIGGRAGNFTSISTFTGGAQLSSGTHTASMVLWDYGGSTGALIGTSTFAPAVAYWAPGSGAGGNGTWTNSNAYWTTDAAGLTTLIGSDAVGACLVEDAAHRAMYLFNHFEYDSDTLKQEYDRDITSGTPINVPMNYYPDDDPARQPLNRWRSHAHLLYGNWINEIYQSTPYDLAEIGA
jgi:hypothetical protein